ncbi:phenylalanine--tRNA ligase subunit alpha [Vulcanisaeta thermophila]|uniref:phenylalanine--tRNA ligase subunit alpha n=1 Tax=Vulcanisaeta thermophila TaxID=867917 RepID=UPI000852B975|nr:phenylalanine--tRNA ligase subunit alpha [Vulcanisaeta thermophila]
MASNELVLPQQQYEILRVLMDSGSSTVDDVAAKLNVNPNSLMRSIAELEGKGLLVTSKRVVKIYELTEEGKRYVERGLPELRLIRLLTRCGCNVNIRDVESRAREYGIEISQHEVNFALSALGRAGIVRVERGTINLVRAEGVNDVERRQEVLNSLINAKTEDEVSNVLSIIQEFVKRGLVRVRERSLLLLSLTDNAREALVKGLIRGGEVITALTPELIMSGAWRNAVIKKFDLSVQPPQTPLVTKHFLAEFIKFVKEVFISLGFEEEWGPHVETEFWNFDALFQAQDHPAREIHDTYFLKYPSQGKLPDGDLVNRVARTHEDGWVTGSLGWGYRWDPGRAARLVLRTQTTAVSVRALYRRGDGEYRVFTIDRVFRPEVLDQRHSMEFHQADGIVVGEGLSFKHLLGILEALARGMGLRKVMFKPAYFPFTSPSAEGYAYHERLGWIEFVGSGIFRPEVVMPLGIRKSRVLAFGMGLDRIAMILMGIDDIRELFTRDVGTITRHWRSFTTFLLNRGVLNP